MNIVAMLHPLPLKIAEDVAVDILAENPTYDRACELVDAALRFLMLDDEHKAEFFGRHSDYVSQHGFGDELLDVAWFAYCQRPHAGEQNAVCWSVVEALGV